MSVLTFSSGVVTTSIGDLPAGWGDGPWVIWLVWERTGLNTDGSQILFSANDSGNFPRVTVQVEDSGDNVALVIRGFQVASFGFSTPEGAGYKGLLVSKPSTGDGVTPRANLYNWATTSWAGWTNGDTTVDTPEDLTAIQHGNGPGSFPLVGSMAIGAVWHGTVPSESALVNATTGVHVSAQKVFDLTPDEMWRYGETDPVTSDTGSADETSSSGVTINAGTPPSYSLTLSGGGTDHTATPSDTTGLTDTVTAAATKPRTVTDTTGLVDTATKAATRPRTASDTTGLVDTVTAAATKPRTVTDTTGLVDTATAAVTRPRTVTDTTGLTDTVVAAFLIAATVTDSTGLTDLGDPIHFDFGETITDPAGLTDSTSIVLGEGEAVTDTTGLADTVVAAVSRAHTVTDTAGLTDLGDELHLDFGETITDPAGLTDSTSALLGGSTTRTDTTGLTDTVTAAVTRPRTITDSVGLADLVDVAAGQLANVTDTTGLTDTVATAAAKARTTTDTTGLVDTTAIVRVTARTVTDTAGLADAVSFVLASTIRTVTDSLGLVDTVAVTATRNAVVSDSAALTDSVTAVLGDEWVVADTMQLVDQVTATLRPVLRAAPHWITDTSNVAEVS